MAEQEVNAINHLLEVEQNAQILAQNAQEDADKKISAAKAQADQEFKTQFDKIVAADEKDYEEKTEALRTSNEKQIKEYKEKISASKTDSDAFNKFLDKVLA